MFFWEWIICIDLCRIEFRQQPVGEIIWSWNIMVYQVEIDLHNS